MSYKWQNGPTFRWFAWYPVQTKDRGWRWLRPVWRRRVSRVQEMNYDTQLVVSTRFVEAVDREGL